MMQQQASKALEATAAEAADSNGSAWISRLPTPRGSRKDGALSGLVFAAKDNIDVAGVRTTAGCPAFAYTPSEDATVVRRLLEAGAFVAGKTNMDQFACGLSGTRSPFGAVPNAFDANYISGGSSSGSAFVVAKGEVDFALGTDTAGSGRVPAALNNIVGFKPSRGLISAHGVVPAAQSVDCVSIFSRTVATAARVLDAAMGHDPADPYSRALRLDSTPWPHAFRFAVPATLEFFGDDLSRGAFRSAVARLRELGGSPVAIDYAPLAEVASLLYESALVAERYSAVRSFFDSHEREVVEPVRSIIARGSAYSASEYAEAQVRLHRLAQRARVMWDLADVLVVPTVPTHYTIEQMRADPVKLNRNLGMYTNFVNLLDYAAIAVPASMRVDGLPFGVTFVAPCGSDWRLAELGQRFHHATGLTQGATGEALPAMQDIAGIDPRATVRVAVVGAHLSGMPLNAQLTERGAVRIAVTQTAPGYRLYALPGTRPPKPGLVRVAPGEGARIAVEVWEMPASNYGSFVALIPAPLGIATLELEDGSHVQGFACEAIAVQGARDITSFGGWRSFLASAQAT